MKPSAKKIIKLFVLIIFIGFLVGCSKDDSHDAPAEDATGEEILPLEATIPSPPNHPTIYTGDTVAFEGSVSGGTEPYTYLWEFAGVVEDSTVKDPGNVTFNSAGTYLINFKVADANENVKTVSRQVTVYEDLVPSVTLDSPAEDVSVVQGVGIRFSATVSGGNYPVNVLWDFQGGAENIAEEDPGVVLFEIPGTYIVTFTATDANGDFDDQNVTVVVEEYIPIEDTKPQATIDSPVSPSGIVSINIGDSVNLQGSVVSGNAPFTYLWSFPGGDPLTSEQEDPGLVTYNAPGSYRATFLVRDVQLDFSQDYIIINVLPDIFPAAVINSPGPDTTIIAGQYFTFLGNVQNGNAPFTYNWNFGGGADDTNEKDPGNIIFDTAGNYTVTLTVTDIDGDVDDTSVDIMVEEDMMPTAVIDRPSDAVRIAQGNFVTFFATATGGNNYLRYFWDFGDADINAAVPMAYRTCDDPRNVIFDKIGIFTVTFRVTDSDGDEASDFVIVEVGEDVEPIANIESPTGDITIDNGQSVFFDADVEEGNPPFYYRWDFDGNGVYDSTADVPGEIRFYSPGTFNVTLTVYDSDGDSSSDSVVVTVNEVPISVPDVSGMCIYDVRDIVEDAGLIFGTVNCEHSDTVPLLGVTSQLPLPGDSVASGTVVDLTISLGLEDVNAYWSEKGSVVNLDQNAYNLGIWFMQPAYPLEIGAPLAAYTEQVLDVPDPIYITTWDGSFTDASSIIFENADVLEEGYSVDLSATGSIPGSGTITYSRFVIQSGTYAGSWILTGIYELEGYSGSIHGYGTTNSTLWAGLLEGEINGFYMHNEDQGELYITSMSGVQTSGTVTCSWDTPANTYSMLYPDLEVLIQQGIKWFGTGSGFYSGDYEHSGASIYLPMYRAGRYNGISTYNDQIKSSLTLVQADELYAEIITPFGDMTIDQGESLDFRGWVSGYNWPYTYAWDFDDDGVIDSTRKNPGNTVFDVAGTYHVTFTVTDNEGNTFSDSIDVTVNYVDTVPIAQIANPRTESISILEGNPVTFEGLATNGNEPFVYEWDFNNDGEVDSSELSPGDYTYPSTGTFTATFTVTDYEGDIGSDSVTIEVAPLQPVPGVTGIPLVDAETVINAQGLIVGVRYVEYSAGVDEGNVISQDPSAESMVEPGSSVNLTVSLGPVDPSSFWDHAGIITGSFPTYIPPLNTPVSIIEAQHQNPYAVGAISNAMAEYLPSLITGDNHADFSGVFTAVPPVELIYADVTIEQTMGSTGTVAGGTSIGDITGDMTCSLITYTIANGYYIGHRSSYIVWELGEYTGIIYSANNSSSGDFLGESSSGDFWGRVEGDINGMYRTTGLHEAEIYITSIEGSQASGTLSIAWSGSNYNESSSSHSSVPLFVQERVSWSGQGSGCVTGELVHSGTSVYLPGFNVGQYLGEWFYYETDPNNYDQSGYIYTYLNRNTPSTSIIPFIEGLSQQGAQEIITSHGLVVGNVTQQVVSSYPSGHVVSQNPPAGGAVVVETSIDLIISQ